jgi:hypothetical protein
MEGTNRIIFCETQMVKAINAYLNEHVFSNEVKGKTTVKSVKYSNQANNFEILLNKTAQEDKS